MTTPATRAVARLLSVRGVGPARLRQVLARARERGIALEELSVRHSELGDVLSAPQHDQFKALDSLEEDLVALENAGISLVSVVDDGYPARMRERLHDQAPPLLWIAGNRDLLSAPTVGFCGSRAASPRGIEVTRDCADQLSRAGCTIVSGYAAGVDMQAHQTALEAGRSTVVVLAEGIRRFRVKRELKSIWSAERTCIVSEFPSSAQWSVGNAMHRPEQRDDPDRGGRYGGEHRRRPYCARAERSFVRPRVRRYAPDGDRKPRATWSRRPGVLAQPEHVARKAR
jgi:predicted Rossmann fold nucleotide-binding protein DprA/Smf involved in DNA uptake